MAYSLNICTKNHWNRTLLLKLSLVVGWYWYTFLRHGVHTFKLC